MKVPFFDLPANYRADRTAIDAGIAKVLQDGPWIGGPVLEAFESAWAAFAGQAQSVGVANGTDAITLALWAAGIGAGDEVLVPALSAFPTVVGVQRAGARPVFVDVDEQGLMDPALARRALGPRTRAIVPVHLYGRACDMTAIQALAASEGLRVIEDCAQAHGVRHQGRPVGQGSFAAAWSFYPTKNLGGVGDAGAVSTDDPAVAARLRRLRNYGQTDRYRHDEPGVNSRLDPLQAAILLAKLPGLEARNERRRAIGDRYDAAFKGLAGLRILAPRPGDTCNRHLYPVFMASPEHRDALQKSLASQEVESLIHYPIAMCDQGAAAEPGQAWDMPMARRLASTELSLPVQPEMSDPMVEAVIRAVQRSVL